MVYQRDAINPVVQIDGALVGYLKVLKVEQSAGFSRMDHAVLQYDLGRHRAFAAEHPGDEKEQHILRDPMNALLGKKVHIKFASGGLTTRLTADRRVHWGELCANDIDISQVAESHVFISRVLPNHFGRPITFQSVINAVIGTPGTTTGPVGAPTGSYIHEEVVFNPMVEDTVAPNMRVPSSGTAPQEVAFIHPQAIRTNAGGLRHQVQNRFVVDGGPDHYAEDQVGLWTLPNAIWWILHECNNDEKYITNPTADEILGAIAIADQDRALIRNHKIRFGSYMPDALDQLLNPYGYRWSLDYEDFNVVKLVIWKGGGWPVGQPDRLKKVYLPKPSEGMFDAPILNRDTTNAARIHFTGDTKRAIQSVTCFGDFTHIEITTELIGQWEPDDVPLASGSLTDIDTNVMYLLSKKGLRNNPDLVNVFRKFGFNEGGDSAGPIPDLTTAFRAVWGNDHPIVTVRRRRFLPTLTQSDPINARGDTRPIGQHQGIDIELWSADLEDEATGEEGIWVPLPKQGGNWSVKVLKDECSIYFNGETPPPLIMFSDSIKIRVTATIQSDTRISDFKQADDPAGRTYASSGATMVLNRPKSFHARRRYAATGGLDSSKMPIPALSSVFTLPEHATKKADEISSLGALRDFTNEVYETYLRAEVSGGISIEGIDDEHEYRVGDVIEEVVGRDITPHQTPFWYIDNPQSYPNIIMIRYDIPKQKTLLHLEDIRRSENYMARER
jgi:hypothetical protein